MANNLVTGFPSAALKDALDAVAGADGLIAVTPTFRASFSGLFKSFVDVLDETSLGDKPVLIARHRRHRPALAGAGARDAAALHLPARGGRADRRCSPRPTTGPEMRSWRRCRRGSYEGRASWLPR